VFLSEKIEEEIQEMRRKLQEVVEEFEVRSSVRQVRLMLSISGFLSHAQRAINLSRSRNQLFDPGSREPARRCERKSRAGR
jgi:hypothetical protein